MTTFCKNPNINLDKLVYQIPNLNSQIMFLPVLITKTLGHPTTWISISIVWAWLICFWNRNKLDRGKNKLGVTFCFFWVRGRGVKQGLCFYWVKHFWGAAGLNCHGQIQIIVNNFWGQFYVTNNFIARNFGSKLFFSKIIYSQYIFGSQHSYGLKISWKQSFWNLKSLG